MADELPLALRRTRRMRRQQDLDGMPKKMPTAASTRKSSRATGVAQKKPATTTTRAAGKKATRSTKASITAATDDDAADDSATLVDDADDSITALDDEAPAPSSNKRKRPSTTQQAIKKPRRQPNNNPAPKPTVVHVVPLRTDVLDPHITRLIRRNGLSAVQNAAYAEKRARRQRALEELRRAREELAERDAEIGRLRELTALFGDGGSFSGVEGEGELSRLRGEVLERGGGGGDGNDDELMSSPPHVARGDGDDDDDGWAGMDGMSDAGVGDGGDEEFGEASLAEMEMGGTPGQQHRSTATRPAAVRLHGTTTTTTTTLTPPSTSPTKPASASSPVRQIHSSNGSSSSTASSSCDAGVQAAAVNMSTTTDAASQACAPDPAVTALTEELGTLRAEVASLGETLRERDAVQARVGEKLALARHSHGSSSSSPPPSAQAQAQDQDLELQLDIVLQDLAEKTHRLGELTTLLVMMPGDSTDDNDNNDNDKEATATTTTAQLATALQSLRGALADLEEDGPSSSTTTPPNQCAATTLVQQAAARLRELDDTLRQRAAAHDAVKASDAAKQTQITSLSADVAHLAETIAALREELGAASADLDAARDAALQQKTAAAELEAQVARDKGRAQDAVRAMRAQMLAALRVGEGFLGDDEGVAKSEGDVPVVDVDGGGGVSEEAARHPSDDSGLGLGPGEDQQLV